MKTATAVAVAAAMCLSSVEEANAASHAAAIAALKWSGSKNGVCGAYNDVNDYTMVGVGPCNPTDQTKAPYAYTWQKAVGTAITTDDTTYLTAPVLTTSGDKKQNIQLLTANSDNAATKNGYIDFANKKSTNPVREYSYVMTGNLFGSATMGAYLGMASYLNTGTTTIKTRTNDIYGAGFGAQAYVDRSASGGSKYGAPAGPYTMCISDKVAGKTTCDGTEREFAPGAYKFSIYGASMGTAYAVPTLDAGKAKYLGVRMLMGVTVDKTKLKGSYDLAFNGGKKTLDTIGTDDVTDMTVTYCEAGDGKCHKETFTFPSKYNTGPTNPVPAAGTAFGLTETKTIKIKASKAKKTDGTVIPDEMYVDYLMEIPTSANQYLIYDPDVKSSTVAASDVPPSAGGTKGQDSGSAGFVSAQTSAVASVVAAVAAFFMM
jgi:hypothetical protein